MKPFFLLPHKFRIVGGALLLPAFVLLYASLAKDFSIPWLRIMPSNQSETLNLNNYDMTDEAALSLCFLSLFMIAFSKEKKEDEYVQEVRLKALQVSVYVNYLVLLISTFCFYGLSYLYVLYGNLFTILLIFIMVYYYQLHLKPRLSNENIV